MAVLFNIWLLTLFIGVVLFIRNTWVYRVRMKWLLDCRNAGNFDLYGTAINYDGMMWRIVNWSRNINSWQKNG